MQPTPLVPGPDPDAAQLLGRPMAASCCSLTTWRWAPAPSIRRRRCGRSGPQRWNAAYVQPSRRPKDGRYGENPNRLQHYYQYQVILKPNPPEPAGALSRLAGGDRHRPAAARHPLRRGRLGKPDAGRLGARLGMLVRRHGSVAVHLFPAGLRHRMRAGLGRADLRARAARHVCAGRRQRLRAEFQRPRGRRTRSPMATSSCRPSRNIRATISSTPTRRCCCGTSTMPRAECKALLDGGRAGGRTTNHAAPAGLSGLRPVHQGQPRLQPARCARRHLGRPSGRATSCGCATWPRPAARRFSRPRPAGSGGASVERIIVS